MFANVERDQADARVQKIEAAAEARLREARDLANHPIACKFRGGTLTLRGHVPSHFLKQTARALVQHLEGVETVDNRIDVIPLPVDDPHTDAPNNRNHEYD